ncbi:MAG: molybdenum cofactor sulfurase [Planctomycetes bacterium RBG_16_64_10]|nr:MAG: molybdenum cofactor sulfurase [Planctomycetes bacterium RBG_16_64_10]
MSSNSGTIAAISISDKKGVQKTNVDGALLLENFGIKDDAHAGNWHRQVSLLDMSSIDRIKAKLPAIAPGNFAENITTSGLELFSMPVGTLLKAGKNCLLRITQIGKECHTRCAIYYTAGDCVMPREGVFAEVLRGGDISVGDTIEVATAD